MTNKPAFKRMVCWLALVVLLISSAARPASTRPAEIPGLVRIEITNRQDAAAFSALGLPIYGQIYQTGRELVYLAATDAERAALNERGLAPRVLDPDRRTAAVFLMSAYGTAGLPVDNTSVTWLDVQGSQAIVRAEPLQIEPLAGAGIELQRLNPHPYVPRLADHSPALPQDVQPEAEIMALLAQVSSQQVAELDGSLSGEEQVNIGGSAYTIATRFSRTVEPIAKATQYAYEYFQALGLETSYHEYVLSGSGTRRNVVAEQIGATHPEQIYLLTAHLDSTATAFGDDPYTYAPGADDNASGSVGVLLAAKLLSQHSFEYTLRYVLFTGEEQGLYGSAAYAQDMFAQGEDILAVLNLDMIAYNSDTNPIIELHTRPGDSSDQALADLFSDVITAYGLNLAPEIEPSGIGASDHASFWDYGYPGILAIEDFEDFTPYYHSGQDRLNSLNLSYFTDFIKASMGSIAHLAGLRTPAGVLSGVIADVQTGQPVVGAQITAVNPLAASWNTASAAGGSYQLTLPPDTYTVTAQAIDYLPASISNVLIVDNQTTYLDIALPVCQHLEGLDFIYSPLAPEAGEPVRFEAQVDTTGSEPIQYTWRFGDSSMAAGEVVTHTFAISGMYNVLLSASNCDQMSTSIHSVLVSGTPALVLPPSALWTVEPGQDTTQTLTLTNTGTAPLAWSLVPTGNPVWLTLPEPDGTIAPFSQQDVPVHVSAPAITGTYSNTLIVNSNDPLLPVASLPVSLSVQCAPPGGLEILYDPWRAWTGYPITFTADLQTGTAPVSYTWEFGDGGQAAGAQVSHTFDTSGAYTVTLTASNCAGEANTAETLSIQPPPVLQVSPPAFALEAHGGETFTQTLLINNSGGSPLSWVMSSQPGVTWLESVPESGAILPGEEISATLHFQSPNTTGLFTTTLIVDSNAPISGSIQIPVGLTILCTPISGLAFDYWPAAPLGGETIAFTGQVAGGTTPITYTWSFDGELPPMTGVGLDQIQVAFPGSPAPQIYSVQLQAANHCSQTPPVVQAVTVWPQRAWLPVIRTEAPD